MLAMRWARDLSIRWKLVLIAVLTCAIAELFAGAAATYYSGTSYELQKRQDAEVQTNELAASLSAPLAFGDSSAARGYLDALKADRGIAAAGAYDATGKLFASYARAATQKQQLPARAPKAGQQVESGTLMVSAPVVQAGNDLGRVFLIVDVDPLAERLLDRPRIEAHENPPPHIEHRNRPAPLPRAPELPVHLLGSLSVFLDVLFDEGDPLLLEVRHLLMARAAPRRSVDDHLRRTRHGHAAVRAGRRGRGLLRCALRTQSHAASDLGRQRRRRGTRAGSRGGRGPPRRTRWKRGHR